MASNHNILLDTCVYLRLAYHLHPIIGKKFGENEYRCYLNTDFLAEFNYEQRLEEKFQWVYEEKFVQNRKNIIQINDDNNQNINITYDYLHEIRKENKLSTRYYDLKCLATASVLKYSFATDDYALSVLANIINIKKYSSLEILNLMRANRAIDNKKIKTIIRYWILNQDEPRNCKEDTEKILKIKYNDILKKK